MQVEKELISMQITGIRYGLLQRISIFGVACTCAKHVELF